MHVTKAIKENGLSRGLREDTWDGLQGRKQAEGNILFPLKHLENCKKEKPQMEHGKSLEHHKKTKINKLREEELEASRIGRIT